MEKQMKRKIEKELVSLIFKELIEELKENIGKREYSSIWDIIDKKYGTDTPTSAKLSREVFEIEKKLVSEITKKITSLRSKRSKS